MKKQTSITKSVYQKVYERDNGQCIVCGRNDIQCHHFIPRSCGGRGIEENLVMLCTYHHKVIHESKNRNQLNNHLEAYLKAIYSNWDKDMLKYRKGR